MTKKLFVSFFILLAVVSSKAGLLPSEKDKILFMIFENQNKKILFNKKVSCKVSPLDWTCANQTAKQFLMNVMRVKAANPFVLKTEVDCQPITSEMQKNIEMVKDEKFGTLEFRREVRQSLKGQWLCYFQIEQNLTAGAESFDDKALFLTGEDGSAKNKLGLSFIMNRDKNRIVSRKFSGWFLKEITDSASAH